MMDTRPESRGPFGTDNLQGNISVLLVDDNRVNQFLGKRILKNLGIIAVELAGNGEDAFHLVKTNRYDILLTDVEMPGMNGYELSKAIREYEGDKNRIIIIALTANASDLDRANALEAGIDDYLTKPYSPQDLQEVLQKHLVSKERIVLEEIQPQNNTDTNSGINNIYSIFHQNKDDVRHFLHMLSGQIPELVAQIKTGIINEHWEEAFQAAHKLKSPVKMLADTNLVENFTAFTEDLKDASKIKILPSQFEELLPTLESLLVLVNKELEELG